MTFEEMAFPPAGPIKNGCRLLRVAQEWRQKLDWGEHADVAKDLRKAVRAIESYLFHYEQEFSQEKDYFKLRGQDNIFRYMPIGTVAVRLHEADTLFDALARIAAVRVAGCTLLVSIPPALDNPVVDFLMGEEGRRLVPDMPVSRHSDASLIRMIPKVQRIRYAAPDRVPDVVFEAAAETGFYIARTKVMMEGRLELIHYFQEQAVSNNYHRYGNLGERTLN
jgi:RHH-type proline utilization regulon transcriptional repressor/proline dehydrogenase/delta 1-pyrroline-5-carboxylate dehydrogenase